MELQKVKPEKVVIKASTWFLELSNHEQLKELPDYEKQLSSQTMKSSRALKPYKSAKLLNHALSKKSGETFKP
jgi:hypothetical protein